MSEEKVKLLQKHGSLNDEATDKQIQEITEFVNHNTQILEKQNAIKTQRIGKTSEPNKFHIGTDDTGTPELAIKINGVNYKITLTEI